LRVLPINIEGSNMHRKSNDDVKENLDEISQKLGSISTIQEELLPYCTAVEQRLAGCS